jgi:hypothetical protein
MKKIARCLSRMSLLHARLKELRKKPGKFKIEILLQAFRINKFAVTGGIKIFQICLPEIPAALIKALGRLVLPAGRCFRVNMLPPLAPNNIFSFFQQLFTQTLSAAGIIHGNPIEIVAARRRRN